MNSLESIIRYKRREIALAKEQFSMTMLEKSIFFNRHPLSLKTAIDKHNGPAIIAEFKRRSPSKGIIHDEAKAGKVARSYADAGAVGISVLTDRKYFGGSADDLVKVRDEVELPILRKDFIIDDYQVYRAKAMGADLILLIAAILTEEGIRHLAKLARSLGMEVLFEVHRAAELQFINEYVNIVGVNNRDLDTLRVDTSCSHELAGLIPPGITKISESGFSKPATVADLYTQGYDGFLIGESFMKQPNPGEACKLFIDELKSLTT
jgi:indole-3-glycerol phosphate synthase